jgi:hypothetical protein
MTCLKPHRKRYLVLTWKAVQKEILKNNTFCKSSMKMKICACVKWSFDLYDLLYIYLYEKIKAMEGPLRSNFIYDFTLISFFSL